VNNVRGLSAPLVAKNGGQRERDLLYVKLPENNSLWVDTSAKNHGTVVANHFSTVVTGMSMILIWSFECWSFMLFCLGYAICWVSLTNILEWWAAFKKSRNKLELSQGIQGLAQIKVQFQITITNMVFIVLLRLSVRVWVAWYTQFMLKPRIKTNVAR
jgi:hypothetical protein